MNGKTPRSECQPNSTILSIFEEQVLVKYLLDRDDRGFGLNLAGVEDMANLLLESRRAPRVGRLWPHRFFHRKPELQMQMSRANDFQRALCEDPDALNAWFRLVENMMAKYGIVDCDFYNFDETGFMIRMITSSVIVARAERKGRGKKIQPGNRE